MNEIAIPAELKKLVMDEFTPLLQFVESYVIENDKLVEVVLFIPEGMMEIAIDLEKVWVLGFKHLTEDYIWREIPNFKHFMLPPDRVLEARRFTLSMKPLNKKLR